MPVYNVEKYVERALISALNQTFDSIEFLIIDDKGADASMDIVREIVSKHPRGNHVRIIDHIVNQGTGATKNTAIKEAKGEYLFFMDSDDELSSDAIQILYDAMMKCPVDYVAASYQVYDVNGKVAGQVILPKMEMSGKYALGHYFYDECNVYYVACWNKLYDISFLRNYKIHCIPSHLCEDQLFSFQVALHASSFIFLDSVTYNYFLRNDSTMNVEWSIGLTRRTAQQWREIFDYKKTMIFRDGYFGEYGHLFINELLNSIRDKLFTVIFSSSLTFKEKCHYISTFCDVPLKREMFTYIRNAQTRHLFSVIHFFNLPCLKIVTIYAYVYSIMIKKKLC